MKKTLIAIDGLDASGKNTQALMLESYLKQREIPCRYLSFPTYDAKYSSLVSMYLSGEFGNDPDIVNPYAASSFFAMDRYSSYMLDWKSDYDEGKIIVANRYTTANAVHQLSKLSESEYEPFLDWLYDYEYNRLGVPKPDYVIYLSLPPAVSLRFIDSRSNETGEPKDIHEKSADHITNSYKAAMFSAKLLGWHTIDCADGDMMRSREDINSEIIAFLADKGVL